VVEMETYDDRMKRLRSATQHVEPPPGFLAKVMTSVEDPEPSIWEVLLRVGRWALVPAALAPATLGLVLLATESWFDDAVLVATSVEWLP
jgi:hypothetical protein